MPSDKTQQLCLTLQSIIGACTEFQRILEENIRKTSDNNYKLAYAEDVILLENVKKIAGAVIIDITNYRINLSMEHVLRFVSGLFAKKIDLIPENNILRKELISNIEEVHKHIYRITVEKGMQ